MKRIRGVGPSLIGAVAAAALGACAHQDEPTASTGGGDCLSVSLARDFRMLDATNLIVFAPESRPYHLELSSGCTTQPGRVSIGLQARGDRLCGFAGDAVILEGEFEERCPVLRVEQLDEGGVEELLWRFGQAPAGAARDPDADEEQE